MNDQIIAIYCLCDDYLKFIEVSELKKNDQKMSDAEGMTVRIIATRFFMAI